MSTQMSLSVILYTRDNAMSLAQTLADCAAQRLEAAWELIVVDNASRDQTAELLRRTSPGLPLRWLTEPVAGQSRALNHALDAARGSLVVFTHDDVRLPPTWLAQLLDAARREPDADVLCGPVTPELPALSPTWLTNSLLLSKACPAFPPAGYSPQGQRQPAGSPPSSANVAVRPTALQGHRFREDLGLSAADDLLGAEAEFVRRVTGGRAIVFVPEAAVRRRLAPALLDATAQMEWAFKYGRTLCRMNGLFTIERWPQIVGDPGQPPFDYFDLVFLLNYYYGQIEELARAGERHQCRMLYDILCVLPWSGDRGLLAPTAAAWLAGEPGYVPPAARQQFHAANALARADVMDGA